MLKAKPAPSLLLQEENQKINQNIGKKEGQIESLTAEIEKEKGKIIDIAVNLDIEIDDESPEGISKSIKESIQKTNNILKDLEEKKTKLNELILGLEKLKEDLKTVLTKMKAEHSALSDSLWGAAAGGLATPAGYAAYAYRAGIALTRGAMAGAGAAGLAAGSAIGFVGGGYLHNRKVSKQNKEIEEKREEIEEAEEKIKQIDAKIQNTQNKELKIKKKTRILKDWRDILGDYCEEQQEREDKRKGFQEELDTLKADLIKNNEAMDNLPQGEPVKLAKDSPLLGTQNNKQAAKEPRIKNNALPGSYFKVY